MSWFLDPALPWRSIDPFNWWEPVRRLEDTSAEHFACAFQSSFDFQPLISKLLKQQKHWKCKWNVIILHATKWVPTGTKPTYPGCQESSPSLKKARWQLSVAGFERLEPWFMGFLNRASSSLIFQVYDVLIFHNSQRFFLPGSKTWWF